MTDRQTKIDPQEFAYHFMDTIHRPEVTTEDMEQSAKEALAAYLSAYYLIQKFNGLENEFFEEGTKKPVSNYQKILSELNNY